MEKMTIDEVLDEIEQAYPLDIFPDTTQAERDVIIANHRGFIDRTSAMMGRHLVKVIRERLASGPTPNTADGLCPTCGRIPTAHDMYCPNNPSPARR